MMERRPALGKGLSALLPEAPEPARAGAIEIDIDLLAPSDQQPRLGVEDRKLDELASSIRANGVIQPILVRRTGSAYRIIAGERRWRAAQKAGLLKVPVVIRDVADGSDRQLLELALVENLQREDLNPIEEALAYQRLVEEFGLTQDQVAAAVGKDRTSVANYLRLLRLPDEVRGHVASGALSMGHARAIAGLADGARQCHAAREVMVRALSVRDTESLVKRLTAPSARPTATPAPPDVHTRAAEEHLRFALGTKVRIVRRRKGGAIEIEFGSEAELNRIYDLLVDSTSSRPST
jgi:ParB family chromosome partitioning protein